MTGDADPRRVLYAEFTALPESVDFVVDLLRGLTEQVRREPGNLVFAASQKVENRAQFFVYEEYVDAEAFAAHLAADYGARFNKSLMEHIVGDGSELTFLMPL
jgi:quinol monooxygenase YgiN